MTFPTVSTPQYPNVPRSAGVPPVMRSAGAIENTVVAVASDAITLVKQFLGLGPQWGIFSPKTGQPVFVSDSVVALDYRQEWRIATYPIEQGAFVSYNKVKEPFDIRVTFSFSGNQGLLGSLIPGGALLSLIPGFSGADSRRTMLQQLDAAIASFDLVSVVTPEAQYPLVNIVHYDYRRQARAGAALIQVDVWCQEVRITARPAFSKAGTDPVTGDPQPNVPGGSSNTGSGGADPGPGSGSTADSKPGGTSSGGNADAPKKPEGSGSSNGGTVQPAPAQTGAGSGAQPGPTTGPGQGGQGERQLLPIYQNGQPTPGMVEKGYEYTLAPGETAGPPKATP